MVDPLKLFWVITNSTYLGTCELLPPLGNVQGIPMTKSGHDYTRFYVCSRDGRCIFHDNVRRDKIEQNRHLERNLGAAVKDFVMIVPRFCWAVPLI